ncbi:NUDIX domain-containing protein [Actinomycetospora corticicola]|uniref:NUDIX domain-containing protein n=1 Tax=Actinomycetospora corticicola TaxID=663602 RepID=UPI003CD0A08D
MPRATRLDELTWRPSAYAIVLRGTEILLLPYLDGVDLPGGGIEFGESLEEGLLRELEEETGLHYRPRSTGGPVSRLRGPHPEASSDSSTVGLSGILGSCQKLPTAGNPPRSSSAARAGCSSRRSSGAISG